MTRSNTQAVAVNIAIFINSLTLGGTEKAASLWAARLKRAGINVCVIALESGPRRRGLEEAGIPVAVIPLRNAGCAERIAGELKESDVIHTHAPGFPHQGDILGEVLGCLDRKIPVIQTNIFGQLQNPAEDSWTDFRLFISWTSCVQAARRAGRKLDLEFFRRQSVAVYPVEAATPADIVESKVKGESLRLALGLQPEHVLFGRFSRPEPNKWTPLLLDAFLSAQRKNPKIRLLLREPPPDVAGSLLANGLGTVFEATTPNPQPATRHSPPIYILPATADSDELAATQMACDVVLHTSSIGESFGYGLAEPMALGKPVITNSVPWHDQAQIELVRHGECGLIASTVPSMRAAILRMAQSKDLRVACGNLARKHILSAADPTASTDRVEMAMRCATQGRDNPLAEQDLIMAIKTAEYLDRHQWGHSLEESLWLYRQVATIRFLRWQRRLRNNLGTRFAGGSLG